MSEKRRDSKRRILQDNERQRKDGRYEYRYTDQNGQKHSLYSWKLVATDPLPAGKRRCAALRDMEKEVQKDILDGLDTFTAKRRTLNDEAKDYFGSRLDWRESTRVTYHELYRSYVAETIGVRPIAFIRYTDVTKFYTSLAQESELSIKTIKMIHGILHPVFQIAVRNGLIRTNPADGALGDISRSLSLEAAKRSALTKPQQEALVEFVKSSPKYQWMMPIITVMLGTGCRVGEVVGLRWQDCDFERNIITIDHTLSECHREGQKGLHFYVSAPKTKAGIREIPMLSEVREALLNERLRQMKYGCCNATVIDGYSGFIFERNGAAVSPNGLNSWFRRIQKKYNETESRRAAEEGREAVLLPQFSCHILRHTFCTRYCENETNLKAIQAIMGHANISTTMNVYAEATREAKQESFADLEGKMKIG